nr:collagen alpha-2(I) chain-like [Globicephala melas]
MHAAVAVPGDAEAFQDLEEASVSSRSAAPWCPALPARPRTRSRCCSRSCCRRRLASLCSSSSRCRAVSCCAALTPADRLSLLGDSGHAVFEALGASAPSLRPPRAPGSPMEPPSSCSAGPGLPPGPRSECGSLSRPGCPGRAAGRSRCSEPPVRRAASNTAPGRGSGGRAGGPGGVRGAGAPSRAGPCSLTAAALSPLGPPVLTCLSCVVLPRGCAPSLPPGCGIRSPRGLQKPPGIPREPPSSRGGVGASPRATSQACEIRLLPSED